MTIFILDSYEKYLRFKLEPKAALILVFTLAIAANTAFSQQTDTRLIDLRKNFAINYLKPDSHFALAKYYLEKGEKVQAFFILEYARRYRFKEKTFDTAYVKFFGDNSSEPSDAAKETFEEAYRLLKLEKHDKAEAMFIKAASLAPNSGMINGWVGRFFYKVRSDNAKALEYYFNSYFLDPHAYETEYVESRIRNITIANADKRFDELANSGKKLAEILTDPDPLVVTRALRQIGSAWNPEYEKAVLECVNNDDSSVRWGAFLTVFQKTEGSRAELIESFSNSTDLRKRGLTAYAIAEYRKDHSLEILKEMLSDDAELVRFDAVSALVQNGAKPALDILRTHSRTEINPILKELIIHALGKK